MYIIPCVFLNVKSSKRGRTSTGEFHFGVVEQQIRCHLHFDRSVNIFEFEPHRHAPFYTESHGCFEFAYLHGNCMFNPLILFSFLYVN